MAQSSFNVVVGVVGLVLGFASLMLAVGGSLAAGVVLGLILGVALAPWVRRGCAWLVRYLSL
jgi:putative effector of murein hydrolase LrgA (UPF0299 family)